MLNHDEHYDNMFMSDNVYGHTVALLERYKAVGQDSSVASTGAVESVHLDLGCGFGRIAEPLTERLECHYIGIDGQTRGVESLKARGFEAHELMFESYDQTLGAIQSILAGRTIRSLTMLDTLEHLPNGDDILRVIRALIEQSNAPAVISVPNVAHSDVGFRLAFGRWDYTRAGLLDHTHARLFSETSLARTFRAVGLMMVDSNDVRIVHSDQHFPETHPALAEGTTLNAVLSRLRGSADDTASINQLIRLVVAGPQTARHSYMEDEELNPKRPFLSIVTRTQGKRINCLVDVLTSLAAQEDNDFEVLVVGHKLTLERQLAVERAIEDCPTWLRDRIRLIRVFDGNRTRPLNVGFGEAKGQYITVLDDDDIPMGHWVSTFRKLADSQPGAVLRAVSARQNVDTVVIRGRKGVRATGGLEPYPKTFDLLQHLVCNQTPNIALAFPRGVYHDLNIRFDETLTTTEDWDFLLRTAFVVGVASSEEITSIYQWWSEKNESSRTVHNPQEWTQNHQAINRKIDNLPILLPAGISTQLRQPRFSGERVNYLKNIIHILTSRSYRYSVPMRWPKMLRGYRDPKIENCLDLPESELAVLLARLQRSSSWKRTAIFRSLKAR